MTAIFGKHMEMGSVCRACLVLIPHDEGYSLLEEVGLTLQFIECSSLTVDKFDEFPKCICSNCYEALQKCHRFQRMCIESMDNFKHFINEQLNIRDEVQDIGVSNEVETHAEVQMKVDTLKIVQKENSQHIISNGNMYLHNRSLSRSEEENSAAQAKSKDPKRFDETTEETIGYSVDETTIIDKHGNAKGGGSGKMFSCVDCPKKFRKQERLKAHLRTHKGLKPYACTECCMEFTRPETLHTHMNRKHTSTARTYACTIEGCNKAYSAKHSLRKHIGENHSAIAPSEKTCICEVCGKAFAHGSLLSRHRFVHLEASSYPFACVYCEKRFYLKQYLKRHLYRHAGLKLLACSYCGVCKSTKTELQGHMAKHQIEKTQIRKCFVCGKSFSSSGSLKLHMNAVHEFVRPFSCRVCDQRFTRSGTLKNHELRHTGSKPHKCIVCRDAFLQKGALNRHMRRIHEIENSRTINGTSEL